MKVIVLTTPPPLRTPATLSGAIELAILRSGGQTGAPLNAKAMGRYVAEFDLSVAAGTDAVLRFLLRRAPTGAAYFVDVQTKGETFDLVYWNNETGATEKLTPWARIDGLQTGRTFSIAVAVEPTR